MKGEHCVGLLCEVLTVSRSGYYKWKRSGPSPRARDDAVLGAKVAEAHRRSRRTYGAPRVMRELRAQGVRTSKRRCARLLKALGLQGARRCRGKPRTTDSRHGQAPAPNRLAQLPPPTGPDQVWVTDITYIKTGEGWLYLAAILDLWSRRIVGWACAPTLHAGLVLCALHRALKHRRPCRGLLHHSDRGVQYVCENYVAALERGSIERSMSRAGNCYDNAAMESFWSTLKLDTAIDIHLPDTRRAAELIIFDYLETFIIPRGATARLIIFPLWPSKNYTNKTSRQPPNPPSTFSRQVQKDVKKHTCPAHGQRSRWPRRSLRSISGESSRS